MGLSNMDTSKALLLIDKLGGRKMLATTLALAAGGITVAAIGDVPANYLALLQTALGAFVGGNIAEHWSKNLKAAKAEDTPIIFSTQAVQEQVATVEAKVDTQTELLMAVGQSVQAVNEILANARSKKP